MSAQRLKENGQNMDGFKQKMESESVSTSSHFPLAPSRETSEIRSSNGTNDKSKEALLSLSNQQKQVKSEPIDDEYLDGNVGNSMRNMDSEASISSKKHIKSMKNGTIAENVCNKSMNSWIDQPMPPYQYQQFDQHSNTYQEIRRSSQGPWITWRKTSDIPSISSETTSVGIPGNSTVPKGNMDSESTLLPSIDKHVYDESINPSIQTMPPHQIDQSSSIPATNQSEIHQESNVLKRKSDSETTLLSSSINLKKVKNEEIFDETVHKAKEIKTEARSIRTCYSCQNVHKYWFNVINIRKETGLDKQWLQNKGLKNGFEPRYISSELMRINSKEPKFIQRFCVTSKKEADQVRMLISSQKWVTCFCLSSIKGETRSIWDLMRQEDIVIPLLIATKAWNDNERDLEMDEMAKRYESDESIRLALSDLTVIRSVRNALDAEANAQLDQLCEELNVEKDFTKLEMSKAARRRLRWKEKKAQRREENEQNEREFNANSR